VTGFSESTISYETRSIPERLLSGNGSGGESSNEKHVDRYWSKKTSVGQGQNAKTKKAGIVGEDTFLTSRPPCLIGVDGCSHGVFGRSEFMILQTADFK